MARAFTAFCCFVVGLQLLVGVPVAVCMAFFALCGGLGPIAIEIHPGPTHPPHMFVSSPTIAPPAMPLSTTPRLTIAPPPNVIPPARDAEPNNPILETRDEQGSPLAGTVLSENASPDLERKEFVAALQKVAAEAASEPHLTINAPTNVSTCTPLAADCCESHQTSSGADQLVTQYLYEMAQVDEQSGNYERADQWRALAREIRRPEKHSASSRSTADSAAPPSSEPTPFDLP